MIKKDKSFYAYIALILTFAIYSYALISFVWIDGLTSFASDSANYMLMALYLSPWQAPSNAVVEVWPYQFYPPFYPIILALTGAAHSFVSAHVLTTVFFLVSLPLIYYFFKQTIKHHWHAVFITALFALTPSTFLNTLGILSENLYILLSFVILLMFRNLYRYDTKITVIFGLIFSALILTRSIGVSLFAAFLIIGFNQYKDNKISSKQFFIPVFITVLVNIIAKLLNKSILPTPYLNQLQALDISGQPVVLINTWFTSWQYYWVDELYAPNIILIILGILSFTGLAVRSFKLKVDALYVVFYIAILLVWPHPGQALRFVYPIFPLLILYSFYAMNLITRNMIIDNKNKIISLLILISFAVVIPTLSFSWNRYQIGKENGYNQIFEFYRFHDIKHARYIASIEKTMFNDMKLIEVGTELDAVIHHFTPAYIALLANRSSKYVNFGYVGEDNIPMNDNSAADYAYISKLHPRRTGKNYIGDAEIVVSYSEPTELLWEHFSNENGKPVSKFLKLAN